MVPRFSLTSPARKVAPARKVGESSDLPKDPGTRGSALILVLLMIVLLATIAVSFLSTARVEQIATRNFTRQTAARGLADMATGEAMAKIASGFNAINPGAAADYTEVITTQPGAITKYFFLNGRCEPGLTTSLYSAGGAGSNAVPNAANLNRLEGPTIDNGQQPAPPEAANNVNKPSITGDTTETLNVQMQDVSDAAGNLIGRIAYYVDDESTKVNLNAATMDRTTLNVATPRSQSFSALTSANNLNPPLTASSLTKLTNAVDGNVTNSTNINSWAHFFRNEQAGKTLGLNQSQLANMSSAPLSDYHLKYTPWGTERLHINDTNDVPLNTNGVQIAYDALTSSHLRNIYGGTFADKYGANWSWTGQIGVPSRTTADGLKQTIANMLQMRTSNTANMTTGRYRFTGAVIAGTAPGAGAVPADYYAHTPFACINEFALKLDYTNNANGLTVYIVPLVEIAAPEVDPNQTIPFCTIELTISNITYDITNSATASSRSYNNITMSRTYTNPPIRFQKVVSNGGVTDPNNATTTTNNGIIITSMAFTVPDWNEWRHTISEDMPEGSTNGIANARATMGDIKLYAGSAATPEALRDWLPGQVINAQLGQIAVPSVNISSDPLGRARLEMIPTTTRTMQHIDQRVHGNTAWTNAPTTLCYTNYDQQGTNFIWSSGGRNQAEATIEGHNTYWSSRPPRRARNYGLAPLDFTNRTIPPDPSSAGDNQVDYLTVGDREWVYFSHKLHAVDASGNALFNGPHDLGKVPSNVNFRRLRFMPRHRNEAAANLIPDWAMLDVLSFWSTNTNFSAHGSAPLNPRGSFACDANLNPTPPAGRSKNLMALASAVTNPASFSMGGAIKNAGGAYPTVNMTNVGSDLDKFAGTNSITATNATSPAKRETLGTAITNLVIMSTNALDAFWSAESTWGDHRTNHNWPTNLVLPAEITEVKGIADYGARSQYEFRDGPSSRARNRSVKENEGRLSAFFPGLTFQGNFFTVYAYAQALDKQGQVQGEAVTKTLVEVEQDPEQDPDEYPPTYRVKKLYTEPVRVE